MKGRIPFSYLDVPEVVNLEALHASVTNRSPRPKMKEDYLSLVFNLNYDL